ncbi:DNA-binding transcriptional LysR family regulator [Paraburkholderia sp. GAS199]|uniref:LysR family transcriptional regulator n=1 Tax=Paraburkholderia sp. GAS199 TaxID=3035126 RepID=UPI003D20317B
MTVFVKVAEAGGFAGAARQLNASPPTVTRTIALLEETLGARLFVRTTRSIKLTDIGERYLDDCRRIIAEVQQAEAAASGSYAAPTGTLTVSAPVLFGRMHVLPILNAFLERHPKLIGHALFVDRMTNLVEEGIDVAVRIGHLPDASYVARTVGAVRRVVCAAPDYWRRHGVPQSPDDLSRHRIIGSTAAWSAFEWRFGAASDIVARLSPVLSCNTNDAAIAAAESGMGVTRVPAYQIAAQLQSGALQTVLDEFEEPPMPVHVVYAERLHTPAKIRGFIDLAVERLRSEFGTGDWA